MKGATLNDSDEYDAKTNTHPGSAGAHTRFLTFTATNDRHTSYSSELLRAMGAQLYTTTTVAW